MSAEDTVAQLGEQILAELAEQRTNDTLTRWLTHHTARLMAAADAAHATGAPDAPQRAAEARAAILQLWEHRSAWPQGWPPPRAARIVGLLNELPDAGEPSWFRGGVLARLQDLHHHILAALVDLVAAADAGNTDEHWLAEFAAHLTDDEQAMLTRASGANARIDRLVEWSDLSVVDDSDIEETDPEGAFTTPVQPPGAAPTTAVNPVAETLAKLVELYRESVLAVFVRPVSDETPIDMFEDFPATSDDDDA